MYLALNYLQSFICHKINPASLSDEVFYHTQDPQSLVFSHHDWTLSTNFSHFLKNKKCLGVCLPCDFWRIRSWQSIGVWLGMHRWFIRSDLSDSLLSPGMTKVERYSAGDLFDWGVTDNSTTRILSSSITSNNPQAIAGCMWGGYNPSVVMQSAYSKSQTTRQMK